MKLTGIAKENEGSSSISFDIISKGGQKIGSINLPEGYTVQDLQFAMWDAGAKAVKYMSKVVTRDATPGSINLDVYVKGTRTPSFGLKQNVSSVAFGNVANMFKLETVG